tara:strand:- start:1462 stop:1635 length:174 start_codon:yes stop_codon:yes gene_type:complete
MILASKLESPIHSEKLFLPLAQTLAVDTFPLASEATKLEEPINTDKETENPQLPQVI